MIILTIAEILKTAKKTIPPLDAYVLLAHLLNCGKNDLIIHGEKNIDSGMSAQYFEMVKRRMNHEPVQYIINQCEFMSFPFYVNENVLIPRPDTEILVETVINFVGSGVLNQLPIGLDLCTGSGCIAISIAHYCQNVRMIASDISAEALNIATRNATTNRVIDRINFIQSDMFTKLPKQYHSAFDFIISNPPYIETNVIPTLGANVKNFEPHSALDGGTDGLDFYRQIAINAKCFLKPNTPLFLEIGSEQAESVSQILTHAGFTQTTILKDLAGLNRIIITYNKG